MKVCNSHERLVAGTAARVAALVLDFERIWPVQIVPRLGGKATACTRGHDAVEGRWFVAVRWRRRSENSFPKWT